jgi:putative sterol carrier protein
MASKEQIKAALNKWAKSLDKPNVASEFEGFNKTMQFNFEDNGVKLQLVIKDKKAKVVEGFNPKAEMSLEVNSDLFLGISKGEVDPMEAFMEGKFKVKGDMAELEKLQVFMDDD